MMKEHNTNFDPTIMVKPALFAVSNVKHGKQLPDEENELHRRHGPTTGAAPSLVSLRFSLTWSLC